MAQVYRERDVRYTRERSRSSSDDERRFKATRYKVGAGGTTARVERIERYVADDDDGRSKHSHSHISRPSAEVIEVDRRSYPDRPRSAFDPPHSRGSDSYRTVEYEFERDRDYYPPERRAHTRVVEETRDVLSPPRDHYWERDRRRPWDDHEIDVRLEKRVVHRDSDDDIKVKDKIIDIHRDSHHDDHRDYRERDLKIERRVVEERDPHDGDLEHYRREVEYYSAPDPPPAPVVIRQKFPEQKVIVHEAAPPPPVIVPRAEPTYIVLRDNHEPRRDDDYYRRRDERRREDESYDEDYYYKRTIIHRDRSSSSDHHKKRHLAEGALAGAGLGALVGSRRRGSGEGHDHKGRKVLAGAALGALGTEVIRRARSAYDDRHDEYEDDDYDRERHRHRSKSRSRLATGLAIGAAALAVAGGLKYMQNNKIDKEEAHRGRPRRRHSNDEYYSSSSRSGSRRGRSRSKSNVAKAGVATAALAGLVHHYRSKSRGKSRSKSRLRTGAEVAAAGLTGAAATKLWERHKNKKDRENRSVSGDEDYRDRSISRSRSRSRSLGRHHHSRDPSADRELGLVPVRDFDYGSEPLESYESASDELRRPRRKHGRRSASGSDREAQKKRSMSKLRDVAAAGLGTAAAAIGIKKYSDHRRSRDRNERSREASLSRPSSRDRKDRARDRRSRDRERRRYEEAAGANPYNSDYDVEAPPPSPPHASGGFPPASQGPPPPPPPPPAGVSSFTEHPNQATTNLNNPYPPYNPQDYVNLPPPPPGMPPTTGQYFPPPGGPGHPPGPENVSQVPTTGISPSHPDASRSATTKQDGVRSKSGEPPTISPSSGSPTVEAKQTPHQVHFRPLSPDSLRTLQRHHREKSELSPDMMDDEDTSWRHREVEGLGGSSSRIRSLSEPSSGRRINSHRSRRSCEPLLDSSDNGSDVVYLPDRFDSSGRPLDRQDDPPLHRPRSSYGEFEYRPQRPGDFSMRGQWATYAIEEHPDMANLAQAVGGLFQRQGGLLGTLGSLLHDEFKWQIA